jgi:hypothetical protein
MDVFHPLLITLVLLHFSTMYTYGIVCSDL